MKTIVNTTCTTNNTTYTISSEMVNFNGLFKAVEETVNTVAEMHRHNGTEWLFDHRLYNYGNQMMVSKYDAAAYTAAHELWERVTTAAHVLEALGASEGNIEALIDEVSRLESACGGHFADSAWRSANNLHPILGEIFEEIFG